MKPKVSIIITTHNRVGMLKRAVKSAQTAGRDIEIIVVDDASTDETRQFCSNLSGIKYIRLERNQRTAGTRNVGITASTSPYLCFLDDDDWRLPNSLDKQAELLDKNPNYGLVYGQYLTADQSGDIIDLTPVPNICPVGDVFWDLLSKNFIGCLTAVFRKECLFKVGLLDCSSDRYGIEDYDLWVRIAELFEFGCVKEPVAVYRKPEPNSRQWSSDIVKQYSLIAKTYETKWMNLPKAKANYKQALDAKKKASEWISQIILYDMAHNTKERLQKLDKIARVIKFNPSIIKDRVFYKIIIKNLILD